MRMRVLEARDAGADAADVVGDGEERAFRIRARAVVRRHAVGRILGEELEPLVQAPGVEQRRFVVEEVLDLGAPDFFHAARISLSH